MIVPFLYALRARGVPVGAQEALALAEGLSRGLHEQSLDGFYHLARCVLIHSEAHLDAFDEAFLEHFKGVTAQGLELQRQLLEWLKEAARRRGPFSEEELKLIEHFDPETLEKLLRERLREQTERHDGGNRWVGTGGTSPFGHSGFPREGIRVGGSGGNRSAIRTADARAYRPYRSDLTIDVRVFAVALRKLRSFAREGGERELDLEGTIDATARNAGELEVVTRPPRRRDTRVVLLMDVGGSMDPYAELVERLFSAASRSAHFKDLRAYYFHNCIYGRLYRSERFDRPVTVPDLLRAVGPQYKLIVVGDALMAPQELLAPQGVYLDGDARRRTGLDWLQMLAGHFERRVWLNPEPPRYWEGNTIDYVKRVFPMFPLTLDGLGDAVAHLTQGRRRRSA